LPPTGGPTHHSPLQTALSSLSLTVTAGKGEGGEGEVGCWHLVPEDEPLLLGTEGGRLVRNFL